ncbi:heme-binding protein [Streptomyces sp. QL37]|uniref:GlcG/HbpS family heme-binding protein n=1 Tax=Streptomyces sp. QL37 TaxID=2093747 RepID=UPI0021CB0A59|nr:heme-binding protein [Streptomyces sp. QL37]
MPRERPAPLGGGGSGEQPLLLGDGDGSRPGVHAELGAGAGVLASAVVASRVGSLTAGPVRTGSRAGSYGAGNGNTLVTLRGDGAGPQSPESAVKKAYTAVSWNAPTSELVKRLEQAPNLKDIPGTLFLAGGSPVQAKGAPVAGIGVAGAPSGDLDEKFAAAGVAAVSR